MTHEKEKAQYEYDCKTHGPDAYKLWEFQNSDGTWETCLRYGPEWRPYAQYRRKETPFEPLYFTGLPRDRKEAEQFLGSIMEFSEDGNTWEKNRLKKIDKNDHSLPYSYRGLWSNYIRTCPETFSDQHPTIKIIVNDKAYNLPKPETEAPPKGTEYFLFSPDADQYKIKLHWIDNEADQRFLRHGLVHLTDPRVQIWVNWWEQVKEIKT
jgi:hypothetical protein